MQEIAEIAKTTDIVMVKYLVGGLLAVCGSQLALIIYVLKKKFNQMDSDHEILIELKTEHKSFHKSETGISS